MKINTDKFVLGKDDSNPSHIARLSSILEDSELLLFVLDLDAHQVFHLSYLSPNFLKNISQNIGLVGKEELSFYVNSFFSNPLLIEHLNSASTEGRRDKFEIAWEISNSLSYWRLNLTPLFGEGGLLNGFTGNALNIDYEITAKLAIQENENRYKLFSALTFEGIFIHENGVAIDVNDAALNLTGYSKAEILSMNLLSDLIAPSHKKIAVEHVLGEDTSPYEVQLVRKDKSLVDVEVKSRYTYQKGKKIRVAAVRDISERKASEKALAESEARWQFALEGSELGVFDLDLISNKVFYSKQYKAMLGYEEFEFDNTVGAWRILVHPQDLEKVEKSFQLHRDGITPFYQQEYRMKCKDGSYKWLLAGGKVIEWTDEGKASRIIGTHLDMDYMKNAELALKKSERKFFNTLHSMASGVVEINLDKTIVLMNPRACEVLALDEYKLLGANINDKLWKIVYKNGKEVEEKDSPLNLAIEGEVVRDKEFGLITANGIVSWITVNASPLFDDGGNVYGAVSIFQDITASKLKDDALRSAHEELKEYNQKLKSMNESLLELAEFKKGMTSMIVHDLKNPLSQIINLAQLPIVRHSSRQMYNMVLNILEVQQFEDAEVRLIKRNFVIHEIIENAIGQLSWLIDKKEIEVITEVSHKLKINADKDLLERVMVNLVSNAAKFASVKGVVKVSALLQNKELCISVEDNGSGVPEAYKPKVFEKFVKSQNKAPESIRSTGLGLAFCKMAIEAHGGEIFVGDSELGGANFWFKIKTKAL